MMSLPFSRRTVARAILALPLWGILSKPRPALAETVWQCQTEECGYMYNPLLGDPDHGITPGTPFEDLPEDWVCPNCASPKSSFIKRQG